MSNIIDIERDQINVEGTSMIVGSMYLIESK